MLGDLFTGFIAVIGMILLWLLYLVVSIGVFVGAVWVVFKIFGIDVDGFTT